MVFLTSIKLRRLDLGLTKAELAARARLTVARLSSIEEDRAPLTTDELLALADSFRVPAASLAEHDRLTVDVLPPRLRDKPTADGRRSERRACDLRRAAR